VGKECGSDWYLQKHEEKILNLKKGVMNTEIGNMVLVKPVTGTPQNIARGKKPF